MSIINGLANVILIWLGFFLLNALVIMLIERVSE